jgi:DnaJ-class molecular chaperone
MKAQVGDQMVALEKSVVGRTSDAGCSECKGTGIVTYWSEITFFEDRRSCRRCEAGHQVEAQIKDIINRTKADKRLRSL